MDNISLIALTEIVSDDNQPRKSFNKSLLQDLSDSIKDKGVLQPILVRPTSKKGVKYMIISGERRFRASLLAEKKEIPCIIKTDISDDEVLEIQIIENLQREKIDPVEEAEAFTILKSNKRNIEDIALKIGKSVDFIYKRIRLANLIDEFKELVRSEDITLTQAHKLCALEVEEQRTIFKALNGNYEDYFINDLIENEASDLTKVIWDLKDDSFSNKLDCFSCPFNSANQGNLFGVDTPTCTKKACFSLKEFETLARTVEQAKSEKRGIVFDVYGGWLDSTERFQVERVSKLTEFIPKDKVSQVMEKPEPITWDEFLEDSKELNGKDFKLSECKKDFKKESDDYNTALNDYNSLPGNEAYYLCLNTFRIKNIIKYTEKEIKETPRSISSKKMVDCTNEEKIQKIKAKEVRKKEIEASKKHLEHYKMSFEENSSYIDYKADLSQLERLTFMFGVIQSIDWDERDEFIGRIFKKHKIAKPNQNIKKLLPKVTDELFNMFVRKYISCKVTVHDSSTPLDNEVNFGFHEIIKEYFPEEIKAIEVKYKQEEQVRVKRLEERIKDLK